MENDAQIMTVADVEDVLQQIHDLDADIAVETQKRDQSIAFHREKIERAKEICDTATADARLKRDELSFVLERYFNANPPKKAKTLKFSGGSFGYLKSSTKFFFNGEEVNADNKNLLEFVTNQRRYEFVKIKQSLDWAKLKTAIDFDDDTVFFADTGEIIDGLRAQKNFHVKSA